MPRDFVYPVADARENPSSLGQATQIGELVMSVLLQRSDL